MNNLSIILLIIGISVFVFSLWGFMLLKRHLRQFKGNYRHSSNITDEKYHELKARQDYLISVSAIIFALLSFIGYTSINNIKKDLSDQVEAERRSFNSLRDTAQGDLENLKITGKNYEDSVRSALQLVSVLKNQIGRISSKDVIKQNIYIVDPLVLGKFILDKSNSNVDYRIVYFKDLITISGQKLPEFTAPPSIICFSKSSSLLMVDDITRKSFKIRADMILGTSPDRASDGSDVKFSLWISQKPNIGDFDKNDFSSDDFN